MFKCQSCGDKSEKWQYITQEESVPLKGGRGSANLVIKCKLCGRENSADIFPDSVKPYTGDGDRKMKTIVSFDCRGMEPVDFSPRNGWQCEAVETGTKFDDVDLSEKEWVDYDEKAKETVGIYELAHQFVRQK
ncbi:CXXC motif containing zinc binding protein-like isoform X2 [Artemia franciscana]|uniref:CXXC motif containing zinc binding protein n=1 Tax=Artemia franciscana TaxID=6661 RepID=A0AA88HA29_ARTSF|nr:hypothetical protein QYM36_018227 [Artemia franciscana]